MKFIRRVQEAISPIQGGWGRSEAKPPDAANAGGSRWSIPATPHRDAVSKLLLRILGLAIACGVLPAVAMADGQSFQLKTEDVLLTIDANWAGGGQGGYYPLRIRLINTGPSRELTFRFEPSKGHRIPRVTKTIQADQNATVRIELLIPMVGGGTSGTLEVLENGKVIEDLKQDLRLPGVDAGGPGSPSVLLISESQVSMKPLGNAAAYLALQQPSRTSFSTELSVQTVSPSSLPSSWISYSTVDLVFVDLAVLARIPDGWREALMHWVQTGGTLIVFNVGSPPAESTKLRKNLGLTDHPPVSGWQPADPGVRIRARDAINSGVQKAALNIRSRVVRSSVVRRQVARVQPQSAGKFYWPARKETFFQRRLMFGMIVVFPDDPFRGSEYDWAWLLQSLGTQRYQWGARHGFSARKNSDGFQKFLIPGVHSVPVYAFLFLITIFTFLIGPLNYILLWRRKRLFLLVMTVPVIAFGTSIVLFGYSMVSHGFSVKSRARSLTILDQRSQEAVSVTRLALFAGLPPSNGLQFSNDTAVYPIWPSEKGFESGGVDWSDGQTLKAGWLRSRTRTQFLLINYRRERGRLEITGPTDGKLEVSNGFEWPIDGLLVADKTGKTYFIDSLKPGESARLSPATSEDRTKLDALIRLYPLELPNDVKSKAGRRRRSAFGFGRRYWRRQPDLTFRYTDNLVEKQIERFRKIRLVGDQLAPSTYLAVFPKNPGINFGVDDPIEFDGYHLLLGYY